jgi:hypothetical protein
MGEVSAVSVLHWLTFLAGIFFVDLTADEVAGLKPVLDGVRPLTFRSSAVAKKSIKIFKNNNKRTNLTKVNELS